MSETTFTDKSIARIRDIHHGNFLDYLSSAYEVLRKIFSYLSIQDLENVSKAFERWKPVVETTKKERTGIESFVLQYGCKECEVWSEASFCMSFSLAKNKELEKLIRKHLREDGQYVGCISGAGIIGTSRDFSQIIQQKMVFSPSPRTPFETHVRIPSLPGVGMKTFVWDRSISFEKFRNNYSLPDNQIVKCLLILITVHEDNREVCEQKDDFVLFLQESQKESFAVGGCLIDFFVTDSQGQEEVTKYVVFYGDKVEAASTVLKKDVNTKQKIESKVEELKMISPKTNQGVLFVFRCYSRNKVSRHETKRGISKWEGDALLKYFPSTPIVGCFGYGEFGKKFPDSESPKSSYKRSKPCDIWELSFSTSIVYVGFNN